MKKEQKHETLKKQDAKFQNFFSVVVKLIVVMTKKYASFYKLCHLLFVVVFYVFNGSSNRTKQSVPYQVTVTRWANYQKVMVLHVCLMNICVKVICFGLLTLMSNIKIYVQQ